MSKTHDHHSHPEVALVFQGGGALGAFQAGVLEGLHRAGIEPDWVVGTSIGAIHAALVAGGPPQERMDRIDAFWDRMALPGLGGSPLAAWLRPLAIMTGGLPGFFTPRPLAWMAGAAMYDTTPMRRTLAELVDTERLASGPMRVSLGAVNVRSGQMRYFDNRRDELNLEHVMASGALAPAFEAVRIDGQPYWDGGLYSNTPIECVLDDLPRRNLLVFAVHLWPAAGEDPGSLPAAALRLKDIQFASRVASHIERHRQLHGLRRRIRLLAEVVGADHRHRGDIAAHLKEGADTDIHVVTLGLGHLPGDDAYKDIDFSTHGIRARRQAGLAVVEHALRERPWLQDHDPAHGMHLHAFRA